MGVLGGYFCFLSSVCDNMGTTHILHITGIYDEH